MFTSTLWRDRDFMTFWASQVLGDAGTAVTQLALPTVAILVLHASAFEVGVLNAFAWVAWLFLALPMGVYADHHPRRPLLITAAVIRALVLLTVPVAFLFHRLSINQLYLVALVEGGLTVAWNLTSTTYLPAMVGKANLFDANSKIFASRSAASLGGPGIGGFLVQAIGAPLTLWASTAAFVVAAVAVGSGRRPEGVARDDAGATDFLSRVKEGFSVIFRNRMLSSLVTYLAFSNVFGFGFMTILLVYAYRTLHLSPGEVGIAMALEGVGALLGAPIAAGVARRFGLPVTLMATATSWAVAITCVPLAGFALPIVTLGSAMFVFGFASVIYDVNQVSMRMSITPDHLQGRMTASARMIVLGVAPIGSLMAGAMAGWIGVVPTILVEGVGALAAVLLMIPAVAGLRAHDSRPVAGSPVA